MKEVQESELLKKIREKAKVGLDIVNEKLNSTTNRVAEIQGALVERQTLENFRNTLESACQVKTISDAQTLLPEDVIPLEMLITCNQWDDMQRLIFKLHSTSMGEKE